MNRLARYRGAMLGLAAGDALGTTLEFSLPGTFEPISDIVGGGPFRLQPGQWTDDTSMALCLAESLITRKQFDPIHQLATYCHWWRQGHLSSTGRCFDIGNATSSSLRRFERFPAPYCGSTERYSAGNGSLMRLAPAPLAFAKNPTLAIERAGDSSRTTHASEECIDACRYFAGLIVGALQGLSKDELLSENWSPAPNLWDEQPLSPQIAEIAAGSFKKRQPPDIQGSGYVVLSLEAALWAFHRSDCFREGALLAVNLGDDADTTGAVYGQIAGAFYGEDDIPSEWRQKLAFRNVIESMAEQLFDLANCL